MSGKMRWERQSSIDKIARSERDERLLMAELFPGTEEPTVFCRRCKERKTKKEVTRKPGYRGYVCRVECEPKEWSDGTTASG